MPQMLGFMIGVEIDVLDAEAHDWLVLNINKDLLMAVTDDRKCIYTYPQMISFIKHF